MSTHGRSVVDRSESRLGTIATRDAAVTFASRLGSPFRESDRLWAGFHSGEACLPDPPCLLVSRHSVGPLNKGAARDQEAKDQLPPPPLGSPDRNGRQASPRARQPGMAKETALWTDFNACPAALGEDEGDGGIREAPVLITS